MDIEQFDGEGVTRDRKNRFADIAWYCGVIGVCSLLFLYSPLLIVIPLGSLLGLLAGLIALVRVYWPNSRYIGAKRAWVGLVLSAITFSVAGRFYAAFLNYCQTPHTNMRMIAAGLNRYADNHNGRYPTSLDELGAYQSLLVCKKYSFYYLHATSTYLLNAYLAGKDIHNIDHPESTILLAEGKAQVISLFHSIADMDFTDHCGVIFAAGGYKRITRESILLHFPMAGKVTKDTWFIKPVMLTSPKGKDTTTKGSVLGNGTSKSSPPRQ